MDSGFTPLHVAVEAGTAAAVRELLRLGADPNCINAGGVPPLHLAASRGEIDILRLLLEHGADPRAKTSKGEDLEAWIEVYDDIIMTNTIRRIQSREGGVSYFRLQAAVKNNSFVAHVQKGNPEVAAMVQHAERLQKEMRRIVAGYVKRNNGAPNTN
jgi:ankyrin repeat protein